MQSVSTSAKRARTDIDLLDRLIEHALKIALCQRRAFEVFDCFDVLGHLDGLFVLNGGHLALSQLLAHFWIVSKVELCAD